MISKYLLLIYLAPLLAKCSDVLRANNMFASDLFKEIQKPNENLVFSPFGIFAVLALLREGATGQTEKLLHKALRLPNIKVTSKQFRDILLAARKNEMVIMEIANKLYTREGYKWKERFERLARDYYHCEVGSESFERLHDAADAVNAWVDHETNGTIRDILTASSFDSATKILVLNAVYFKGTWKAPFGGEQIQRLPFSVTDKFNVMKSFLQNTGTHEYYESKELDAQCLKLNYKNERFSMTFILPNQIMGIRNMTEVLESGFDIASINMKMEHKEVRVTIPIFTYEAMYDVGQVLRPLGLGNLFDRDDLTEMIDDSKKLAVSKFVQKIRVDLTDTGTETGSAIVENQPSFRQESTPLEFTADHSFLFTINLQVAQEYVILFMGKVNSPRISA